MISAGAAALALAACGTASYDASALEKLIRTKVDQHPGFQIRSVACPTTAKRAKGVVIVCTATLRGGHLIRLRATQLDDRGTVHLVANEMFADNVERGIDLNLAQHSIRARSVCPEHVRVVIGRTFDCAVTDSAGKRSIAAVTIVDSDGGFRVRILPS